MITGKTQSGFKFSIGKERLDNMERLDALADVDAGNVAAISRAAALLLGDEQKKALYEHIRGESGNVPIEAFTNEIADIMKESGNQGKNS